MIKVYREKCISCGKCERVCPSSAIKMNEFPELAYPDKCWHCTACIKECPAKAITLLLPPHVGDQRYELLAWKDGKEMVFQILFEGEVVEEKRILVRK